MITNLFADLPPYLEQEQFLDLLTHPGLKIERIVSNGQSSPPGFWYERPQAEWVVLLAGQAMLHFENEAAPRTLHPGDFVNIAPRRRHRVDWTHPDIPTVWLAVHYG